MNSDLQMVRAKVSAGVLLSDVEMAALIGISVKTARNWRAAGKGPAFVKVGDRAVRYRPTAVQEFVARGDAAKRCK